MFSVLHICSDYSKQSLYARLLRSLAVAQPQMRQFMYVPVRTAAELGVDEIKDVPEISFRYAHLLRPYHRVLFRTKVARVTKDVCANTPAARCDLVHAHFLYSDGAVALGLNRRFGTPYMVAVRNTDMNHFQRLRPDLAGLRNDILKQAQHVVFLSPAYRDGFAQGLPDALSRQVRDKALTVPNGLGPEWLQGCTAPPHTAASPLRLLYVGDFTPNKNVAGIVAALRLLQQQRPVVLTVVGGGSDASGAVGRLLADSAALGVQYLGKVHDCHRLMAIYRDHDVLVMPSFHETFGLTYIEALSQGLPIVHSSGQGVDGYFKADTVSQAVDPARPESIARGITAAAAGLPGVRAECQQVARRFSWSSVAQTYVSAYQNILATRT